MAIQEKVLGQARENSTNAVSVYSPGSDVTAIIKSVVLCNNTSNDETFRIFLDDDGTTYDQNTALFYDVPLAANTTVEISCYWPMNNSSGNIAYRSSAANAITITVFGLEIT